MNISILVAIIGVLIPILIPIFNYLRNRYWLRPELTIEIVDDGGSQYYRGIKMSNFYEEGIINKNTQVTIYDLTWQYKVEITNNSELIAFYPHLELNPNGPNITRVDKLNSQNPIKPTETVWLKGEFKKRVEIRGRGQNEPTKEMFPEIQDLEFLLVYQNSKKIKFFTLYNYDGEGNKNKFLKLRPKRYSSMPL